MSPFTMISNISDQLNVILNNKEYAFLFKNEDISQWTVIFECSHI